VARGSASSSRNRRSYRSIEATPENAIRMPRAKHRVWCGRTRVRWPHGQGRSSPNSGMPSRGHGARDGHGPSRGYWPPCRDRLRDRGLSPSPVGAICARRPLGRALPHRVAGARADKRDGVGAPSRGRPQPGARACGAWAMRPLNLVRCAAATSTVAARGRLPPRL